jgi:hypothetical protein
VNCADVINVFEPSHVTLIPNIGSKVVCTKSCGGLSERSTVGTARRGSSESIHDLVTGLVNSSK